MGIGLLPLFLTITNNSSIIIHIQVFVGTCLFISLGCVPGCGIAGSYGNLDMLLNGTVSHKGKIQECYQGVPSTVISFKACVVLYVSSCCRKKEIGGKL